MDGNTEERGGMISVFNGPAPALEIPSTVVEETAVVSRWLADRMSEGVKPEEVAIFVRSAEQLPRARAAVEAAGLSSALLEDDVETIRGRVALGTMHLSKGLEFRAVVVMACDDDVVPLQARIEAVTDDADLQEVYDTERHLLYVACTRARDHLLVTGVDPASEFLQDLVP